MLSPHRVMHPPHGRGTAQHLHHHAHRLNVHRSQGTVIGANSVNGGNIAPGSIDGTQDVIAGSITATSIASGAITANTIAAGAITASSLSAGSVTAYAIAAGAISAYVYAGNSITLAASGTSSSKVLMDQSGIRMYNVAGVLQNTLDAATGSLTVNSGTITGGVVQTSSGSTSKVIMDVNGIRAYDAIGNNTLKIDTTGNLTATKGTITGATVQTSSASTGKVMMDASGLRAYDGVGNNTVNIDTAGNLTMLRGTITLSGSVPAGTNARVVLDPTGIKAWNAQNTQTFILDATTGLIQCTGVITAQAGSSLPAGSIVGSLPGSANRYSNSTFQNGAGVFDFSGWNVVGGTAASGGTAVPPVYGALTCQITAVGVTPPGAPGLTLVSVAGNLGVGQYRYVVTYLTGTNQETAFAAANESTITTTTTATEVTVALPIGPSGVTSRRIYRTPVGGASGSEKLVATINNNTATTFTDNVADAALGAVIPTRDTTVQQTSVQPSQVVDPYKRVVPGLNYSFSHYVWPFTAARRCYIGVNWYDISGNYLSTANGPLVTPVTGQWNRLGYTAMAPANAAYGMGIHAMGAPATAGDVYYVDAFQMEMGDIPSAWAPRPDEILYASVNANMINVAQLNAISADLGTITAGTLNSVFINSGQLNSGSITSATISGSVITGGTITGTTVQTSASGSRVVLTSGNSLQVYESDGTLGAQLDAFFGLRLLSYPSTFNAISWQNTIGGQTVGSVVSSLGGNTYASASFAATSVNDNLNAYGYSGRNTTLQLLRDNNADNNTGIIAGVYNGVGSIYHGVWVMRGDGYTDFALRHNFGRRYYNFPWGPTASGTWYQIPMTTTDTGPNPASWDANGGYICPVSAEYRVVVSWCIGNSQNPTVFQVGFGRASFGAPERITSYTGPSALSATTVQCVGSLWAAAGDVIYAYGGNGSAGIRNAVIGGGYWATCYMEVYKIEGG